jgi:hypothetical protein
MKTLRNVGFEGDDLTQLKTQLAGKKTTAMIKESKPNAEGKTFFNVQYIGGGDVPVEIDADVMKKRVAALFGGAAPEPKAAPAATTPPPTPPPAAVKPGPFGKAAPAKSPFGNK